jgi:hypothetical protein
MRCLACLVSLLIAGCTASGPPSDRLSFRFQWLSYLEGEDIRTACEEGAPARLRLIYNADFNNETRTFDLTPLDGGASLLETRRLVGSETTRIVGGRVNEAIDVEEGRAHLSAEQVRHLVDLLDESGFYGTPPVGAMLRSDDYFWAATGCIDGRFMVQAYPRDRLGQIRFAGYLESVDPLGAPLPPASLRDLPPMNSLGRGVPQDQAGETSELFYAASIRADAIEAWWLR